MSIHWQQSRVHALNSSSSKFNYGFPKSPRFQSTSKSLYFLIYPDVIASTISPKILVAKKVPELEEEVKLLLKIEMDSHHHYNMMFKLHMKIEIKIKESNSV